MVDGAPRVLQAAPPAGRLARARVLRLRHLLGSPRPARAAAAAAAARTGAAAAAARGLARGARLAAAAGAREHLVGLRPRVVEGGGELAVVLVKAERLGAQRDGLLEAPRSHGRRHGRLGALDVGHEPLEPLEPARELGAVGVALQALAQQRDGLLRQAHHLVRVRVRVRVKP